MAEQTIKFGVDVDIRGIDQSIRSTQRLLYFVNSIRLTIVDFQKLLEKPSLETAFWAALQLSYVWTNLIRTIRQFNVMSKGGGGTVGTIMDLMGGSIGGGMGGGSGGGKSKRILPWASNIGLINFAKTSTTNQGLMSTLMGVLAIPGVGIAVGAAVAMGGLLVIDLMNRRGFDEYKQRQRDIARSQGLEY